ALYGDDPKEAERKEAEKQEAAAREAQQRALAVKLAQLQAVQLQNQNQVLLGGLQRGGGGFQPMPGIGPNGLMYNLPPSYESSSEPRLKLGPGEVEVHFGDDSLMKVVLLADVLDLETAYGKLTIPLSDVRRIDCGLRLTPD